MFEKMEERGYLYLVSLLLFTSSFLGLIYVLLIKSALIATSYLSCLCLSLGLYVIIIILLLTSAVLALINIDYELVMFFTFFGIVTNGGGTILMFLSFFNTSFGMQNITFYSGMAFLVVLASTVSLVLALLLTLKAKSRFNTRFAT
ncbi:MAG: hypothetical protein JSW00_13235 [Thermoplasmata archaeon]|nr:MAG: hypothetical protein JSW00_13235 [Thermoplasmata archaeon]